MVAGGRNSTDPQAKKEAWLILEELKPSGFGTAQRLEWSVKSLGCKGLGVIIYTRPRGLAGAQQSMQIYLGKESHGWPKNE